MSATISWPRKTRDMMNHHMDSTVWNDFKYRPDDVIVATYAKSGTTWTQQIIGQLIFNGDPTIPLHEISPWVDLRVPPKEEKLAALEAQTHRRIVKTHLPVDALVFDPQAKYIYIGRDGRDVLWSFYNHHQSANALFYQIMNETPGLVGPPLDPPDPDIRNYFLTWLEKDGFPIWPFWENITSWWALRDLPNVHLVHFNDLKTDLAGEMERIAYFLGIEIADSDWPTVVEHCTFDYMKANADKVAPLGGAVFEGGGKQFINKGVNGRWRDTLTAADIEAYEQTAQQKLGEDCAQWLATGTMPAP